jgi:hypothetical protein
MAMLCIADEKQSTTLSAVYASLRFLLAERDLLLELVRVVVHVTERVRVTDLVVDVEGVVSLDLDGVRVEARSRLGVGLYIGEYDACGQKHMDWLSPISS